MKYSIFGFNQKQVITEYENITISDLLLLDYIYNAIASPNMEHYTDEDEIYVWLQHKKILEDLPILNISNDRLKHKLKSLIDAGLLKSHQICTPKMKGSKSFYGITEKCEYLRYEPGVKNNTRYDDQVLKTTPDQSGPGVKNNTSNNELVNNTFISKDIKDNRDSILSQNQSFLGSANSLRESHKQKDIDRFVQLYNEHCPSLPKIRDITDKRKQAIQYIVKKYSWEDIIQVFDNTEASDFLKGNNDRGWKASFDFILRKDKFVNILEGMYDSKKTGKGKDGLVIAPRASKEDLDGYIYEF